ncbi:hypothetical protein B4Q13_19525 [Lacticaseibacillus rhamnosus]
MPGGPVNPKRACRQLPRYSNRGSHAASGGSNTASIRSAAMRARWRAMPTSPMTSRMSATERLLRESTDHQSERSLWRNCPHSRIGSPAGGASSLPWIKGTGRAEAAKIDEDLVPPELLCAAQEAWDNAVELGEHHGVRNSQATVLAPTGTIGAATRLINSDTPGCNGPISPV